MYFVRSSLFGPLILAVLGVLGNVALAPLAYGIDFLFGSVFALLALRLYGIIPGTIVGAIAGAYTYYLWGHPYALIIFTLEALVVGLIVKYWIRNLVIADMLYWLVFGVAQIWLFYGGVMGLNWSSTEIILLKQPINGINNALLASIAIAVISTTGLKKWIPQAAPGVGIRELTFTLLLGSAYFSFLSLLVYNNSNMMQVAMHDVEMRLSTEYRYLGSLIELSPSKDPNTIVSLYRPDMVYPGNVVQLYDEQGHLLASSENNNHRPLFVGGSTTAITQDMYLWLPERGDMPRLKWQNSGVYFIDKKIDADGIAYIRVIQDTSVVSTSLYDSQVRSIWILVMFSVFTTLIAYFISGLFSRPISTLSSQTANLPEKIRNDKNVEWPKSGIVELQQLADNSAIMSRSLKDYFHKMLDTQTHLEQRVRERTQSLKEGSARSRAIIDNSLVGIISINELGIIESFNSTAEGIFQYDADEVIGKNVSDLMPALFSAEHDGYLQHYRQTGEHRLIGRINELKAQRKDGKEIDIELSVSEVMLDSGRIFIGIVTDITQRKHAENIKNDFVANISHELRTPLTAIRGAIGLLSSGGLGELPERAKHMLDITIDNSERLIRLINDLLDMQKLEAGSDNFALQDMEVMPVLYQCLEQNEPFLMEFGCEVYLSGDLGEARAHINSDKLNQVLTNLISNAAKFSPEGGTIAVQLDMDESNIHISISDQGVGVAREHWDEMFDKFTQLQQQGQAKVRGSGLGLNISRTLLERMGGRIQVVSVVGHGTTFIVSLPLVGARLTM